MKTIHCLFCPTSWVILKQLDPWQHHSRRKLQSTYKPTNLLTSVGIEPTTSGLDVPSLCRLSYKVAQRKSGTILDGESRRREVREPRSTDFFFPFTRANAQWVIHEFM